jgi:hypothetical protein
LILFVSFAFFRCNTPAGIHTRREAGQLHRRKAYKILRLRDSARRGWCPEPGEGSHQLHELRIFLQVISIDSFKRILSHHPD